MSDTIELPIASASRLNLLADLICQREESVEQTAHYLLAHSDDLTPERHKELEQHMQEQTTSLHDMKTEYCRIIGKQSKPFN